MGSMGVATGRREGNHKRGALWRESWVEMGSCGVVRIGGRFRQVVGSCGGGTHLWESGVGWEAAEVACISGRAK